MTSGLPAPVGRLLRAIERARAIDITDEFLVRLKQVNPGLLENGNLLGFDYAIRRLPSEAPLLEIGAFCGLSTNCITYYKAIHGVKNKLITCDRWDYAFKGMGERPIGRASVTGVEWAQFAKECFLRSVQLFSRDDLPWAIEAFSDELFEWWEAGNHVTTLFGETVMLGGKLSFCYIDGDHTYSQVRRDFEHCHRFLEEGGFILLDDSAYHGGSPGVKRLVTELTATRTIGRSYTVVLKNPNYLLQRRYASARVSSALPPDRKAAPRDRRHVLSQLR